MKNKIIIWALIAFSAVIIIPSQSEVSAREISNTKNSVEYNIVQRRQRRIYTQRQANRRYRRQARNRKTYRNYGQYRRTQVGNRRSRIVRQTYYRNGRRYFRNVRVYY